MDTASHAVSSEDLDRLVQFVVEQARPLRIVLFGSAARDELGEDSDIDLLVVMPNGADRRAVGMHLYRQQSRLGPRLTFPVEFVVTTQEIF